MGATALPMSVRAVLCQAPIPTRACCLRAELVGYIQLRGYLTATPADGGGPQRGVGAVTVGDRVTAVRVCLCAAQVPQLGGGRVVERGSGSGSGWVVELGAPGGGVGQSTGFARASGLRTVRGRTVTGLPAPMLSREAVCCAGALWRAALLCAGITAHPRSARPGLAVACPNPLLAYALVALARRLGAPAVVVPGCDSDDTVIGAGGTEMVLAAAAGPDAAALWHQVFERNYRLTRPRRATPNGAEGLQTYNTTRASAAAAESIAHISAVFDRYGAHTLPAHIREAGQLRLAHPHLSLTELAALTEPPSTKDSFSGRLRRLLRYDPDL